MQAGVAVAGDHEGVAGVVRLDEPPQRQRDAFHMLLRLDPEWALGQGRADDLRAVSKAQRRKRIVDAARDGFVRVRIDDADARALPVQIAASVF